MAVENVLSGLPTRVRRLENGLTLVVRPDRSAEVVAIVTHVRAGYFNEPDELVGISHVLEHMYFKGTERRGVGDMGRETKAAGGYLNAGTIYDHTSYYTVLPADGLALGLDIQSDALRNLALDEEELRKELLVIIQESKRKLDNPAALAIESLYEAMFDVHPMRRWRMGTEEGLRRLRRSDVWRYYRNLYRPSNIVLAIAGGVDPARAFELVEHFYGAMPAGEVVAHRPPPEPPRQGFRLRALSGDVLQAHLEWGWRTPGTLHEDTPALDLLASAAGQGRASHLYRRIREPGYAHGVAAHNYTPTDLGVFGISAELAPERARDALAAIWAVVEELRSRPVAVAELDRAKHLLEAGLLRRLETAEGQATLLAEWQALGDWRLAERYLGRLLEMTAEDLLRVAQRYLPLDQATVLYYGPEGGPRLDGDPAGLARHLETAARERVTVPDRDAAAPARAGDAAAAVRAGDQTAGARAGEDAAVGWADRVPDADALEPAATPRTGRASPAAPPAMPRPDRVEDGVHFFDLPGARLAVWPRAGTSLVSTGFFWRGGRLQEEAGQAGSTFLVARTSVKGAAHRDAARIAAESEALGGMVVPTVAPDVVSWTLTVPTRHFAAGFELLADVALRPSLVPAEVERERTIALSDLDQLRDDMRRYPMRLFLGEAFAGHPYGFSVPETYSALRHVTAEELRERHRTYIVRQRPWVLVVGDVDVDEVAAAVAAGTAELEPEPARSAPPPPPWPVGAREAADARRKAQTALVLGFPGLSRGHPAIAVPQVLSNVASGLGGRLFEELRGRRSLAYTVAAYPLTRWLAGAFVCYIATSPERETEAREGLLEQLQRFTDDPVSAEELARAQRYTVGAWKIRGQTNAARLADLAEALLVGQGLRDLREFEDRIMDVTPQRIRDWAEATFDPATVIAGVVRGTGGGR